MRPGKKFPRVLVKSFYKGEAKIQEGAVELPESYQTTRKCYVNKTRRFHIGCNQVSHPYYNITVCLCEENLCNNFYLNDSAVITNLSILLTFPMYIFIKYLH